MPHIYMAVYFCNMKDLILKKTENVKDFKIEDGHLSIAINLVLKKEPPNSLLFIALSNQC